MTRPRGRPPTPSAMSRPSDPVGIVSISTAFWFLPSRMIEPLPKARSICDSAASSALVLSTESLPRGEDWVGSRRGSFCTVGATRQLATPAPLVRTMCMVCSHAQVLFLFFYFRTLQTGQKNMGINHLVRRYATLMDRAGKIQRRLRKEFAMISASVSSKIIFVGNFAVRWGSDPNLYGVGHICVRCLEAAAVRKSETT